MSILWNVIRGGQTRLHNIRMFLQILKKISIIGLVFYMVFIGVFFFKKTNGSQRHLAFRWGLSKAMVFCKFNPEGRTTLSYYHGKTLRKINTTHRNIIQNPSLLSIVYKLKKTLLMGIIRGGMVVVSLLLVICWYLYRIGFSVSKEKSLNGLQIASVSEFRRRLKKIIKQEGNSGLTLASYPLPATADILHTFIVGSSGSGKSVLCKELLMGIRKQKRRSIIYDVSGEYVKNFYNPQTDVILNPLDERTVFWDIWRDCRHSSHFSSLAEALIPEENGRKDFFIDAARTVLADVVEQMSTQGAPQLEQLLYLLLKADFSTLLSHVKGTNAASLLNEEGGRTAASVRAVIAANIKALACLPDRGDPLSIRDWVQKEADNGGFIFITSNAEQLSLLRPLITLWVDIATRAILGLEPDPKRRIYLLLDELASLNRVPVLHYFLEQGRKYGGCAILSTQSYSRMQDIWGDKETRAIVGGCRNWVVGGCNEYGGAEWLSKNLYRQESIEKSEGVSYGAHEVRDSVSLQEQRQERPLVSPTDLMRLPDLSGYLRLGRGLPLVKFTNNYTQYPQVATAFIERKIASQKNAVIPDAEVKNNIAVSDEEANLFV